MLRLLSDVLSLPRCTGCGARGPEWCDRCALNLPDVRWHLIGEELPLCTAFQYEGPIRKTIIDWKERQQAAAHARVRRWFASGLQPLFDHLPELACLPIPSSLANDRLRGGAVLTEVIREIGLPVSEALISARARRDQAGLSRIEREQNLNGAFAWRGNRSVPVLIVDDVVTSGATLRAAADAVRMGGGRVWAAFGLARRGRLATIQATAKGITWGMQGGLP